MKTSKLAATAALVAVLALFGAACSSEDKADDKSTTSTTAEGDSGDSGEEATDTTEPVSDEEYAEQIAALDKKISDAGDDICALFEAQATDVPPTPSNPEQVEQMVDLYAKLLRQMGEAIKGEEPEAAEAMNTAADELVDEAKEAGFSPDFLTTEQPKAFASEGFASAQGVITAKAQTCMTDDATAGMEDDTEAPAEG